MDEDFDLSTICLHADRHLEHATDVSPPLHVSTIYEGNKDYSYSRADQPTRSRVEKVIGKLEGGYTVAYSSGMSAITSLFNCLLPKTIAFQRGYGGTKNGMEYYKRHHEGVKLVPIEELKDDDCDLIYLETPNNPYCLMTDIKKYAKMAEKKKAHLVIDSTFATPIATKPIELGAHFVIHSVTKYLGGHSDLLGGVIVCKESGYQYKLVTERTTIGNVMGTMESWLLLRSLRTLSLRYTRQSSSAVILAKWLNKQSIIQKVWHPSLKSHPSYKLCTKQMKYPPPCFSFVLENEQDAVFITKNTKIIIEATSLGGVESTIDWRKRHDDSVPDGLLRISVGLEEPNDLIKDLKNTFDLLKQKKGEKQNKDEKEIKDSKDNKNNKNKETKENKKKEDKEDSSHENNNDNQEKSEEKSNKEKSDEKSDEKSEEKSDN